METIGAAALYPSLLHSGQLPHLPNCLSCARTITGTNNDHRSRCLFRGSSSVPPVARLSSKVCDHTRVLYQSRHDRMWLLVRYLNLSVTQLPELSIIRIPKPSAPGVSKVAVQETSCLPLPRNTSLFTRQRRLHPLSR